MAARLTDKQKKEIIADYAESGNCRSTAKKFGVSAMTVRAVRTDNSETVQKCTQKREQNTAEILDYLDSRKDKVKDVLDAYIEALKKPEKIQAAKLSEIATAMGIVTDKFINNPMNHQLDKQKLEIELLKLESHVKDSQPEEEAEDNFMDALNGTATEVWEESEVEEDG